MSNTEQILKDLIQKSYRESIGKLNFHINAYGNNGYLEADDGTFLGDLSNKYSQNSIFNKYGTYGSKYSQNSIFNKYGTYGSKYSQQSPFNKYTNSSPKIYMNDQYIGRLTANKYIQDVVPVDIFLFNFMEKMGVLDDRINGLIDMIA